MLRPLLLAGLLLLTACSTAPQRPAPAASEVTRGFSLNARFALRQEQATGEQRSLAGRLDWQHEAGRDRIIISDPLSRGLAELQQSPAGARLTLADGRDLSATSAETLLQQTLGFPLPVNALAGWLTGRDATERDSAGRASVLQTAQWRVEYLYDSALPSALPTRLTIVHTGQGDLHGLELKLRIEEWNTP